MTLPARLQTIYSHPKDETCLLVLPGGGYSQHVDHEAAPVGEWGVGVTSSSYILRHELAHHPVPLQDVATAMRYLRQHHRKIAIIGFSAGGHLAAAACTCLRGEERPDAGILIYPVITMTDPFTNAPSRRNLLGDAPSAETIAETSCEQRVTSETPPIFLFHGADDAPVPVQNSLMFAMALAEHRVPFELHVPAHGPHGFGMGSPGSAQDWTGLAGRWLVEVLA
ncbi:MAG: alpha/beta hydrolase [Fimbriimonas sp.]